jgi:hypothetical protein
VSKALSTSSQRSNDERERGDRERERGDRADGMQNLSRAGSKREKRYSQLSSSFVLPPPLAFHEASEGDVEDGFVLGDVDAGEGEGDGGLGPPPMSAASAASTMSGTSTVSGVSEASTVVPSSASASVGATLVAKPSVQTLNPSTGKDTGGAKQADIQVKQGENAREGREKERKTPRTTYTTIRDFAFEPQDVRFCGLGEDVPKSNRVERVNRSLRGGWVRGELSFYVFRTWYSLLRCPSPSRTKESDETDDEFLFLSEEETSRSTQTFNIVHLFGVFDLFDVFQSVVDFVYQ